MIEIKIEDAQINAALAALDRRLGDLAPLMRPISETLLDGIEQNFAAEGRPQRWAPLAPSTLAAKRAAGRSEKILLRTGHLLAALAADFGPSWARAGVTRAFGADRYAAAHQFGARLPPRLIRPRHKKALAWAGGKHPVKAVRFPGATLPARPFIVLTDDTREDILDLLRRHLVAGN